jgi:hypothetical protein
MRCIKCQGTMKVLETRERQQDGLMRRRYECSRGHRVTTLEVVTAIDGEPLAAGTPYTGHVGSQVRAPNGKFTCSA